MKRLISIFIAMIILLGSVLIFAACESPKTAASDPYKYDASQTEAPELTKEATETPTEAPTEELTSAPTEETTELPVDTSVASEETRALAEAAVEKLIEAPFSPTIGIQYMYQYHNLTPFASELSRLERLDDSTLAFIEIYESYIDYFENADLALYYSSMSKVASNSEFEAPEGFDNWLKKMERSRRNVEVLISLDVFFDKLTDAQRERFYNAMITVFDCRFDAQTEAYGPGNETKHSDFDVSRREQHGMDWDYVYERTSSEGD